MESPLFSVVILVYRHYEHLKTAVNSVLSQDYDNIELIISDDGSPTFPAEKIEGYISQHRKENIRSVIVRCEPQNVGTVKHLNHVKECCHGQYILFLAGDDALYDSRVLTSYHMGFLEAPENCYIEMAQTAMFDEKLRKIQSFYMTKPVQDAVVKTAVSTDALKEMLARYGACLPTTSTCFKKEFFDRFGDFDEKYKLVEDFPMHCRLANENYIIHYVNHVTIKHRDGGISHGQSDTLSASARSYYSDLLKMDKELILPMLDQLPPADRKIARRRWIKDILWLDMSLRRDNQEKGLRWLVYSTFFFLRNDLKRIEEKRNVFFELFVLLCMVKGLVGQMYLAAFSLPIDGLLNAVCWLLLACFVLLSVITGIRRLVRKIKEFPRNTIALG